MNVPDVPEVEGVEDEDDPFTHVVNPLHCIEIPKVCNDEVEVEDPEEPDPECCICWVTTLNSHNTISFACNHGFCSGCVRVILTNKHASRPTYPCPMCRAEQSYSDLRTKLQLDSETSQQKLPFAELDFPDSPSFDFIASDGARNMILSAYRAIQHHRKWKVLYDLHMNPEDSFMMSQLGPDIYEVMSIVDEYDQNGHSGASMGFTMRTVHWISTNGYERFRNQYLAITF